MTVKLSPLSIRYRTFSEEMPDDGMPIIVFFGNHSYEGILKPYIPDSPEVVLVANVWKFAFPLDTRWAYIVDYETGGCDNQ